MTQTKHTADRAQLDTDLEAGFRVADITVWPRRELLVTAGGEEVHLEPKVMQVLVELARCAQTPVSRDELLDRVWADAVVGDEVLSRAISLLRSSLGDDRTKPKFIRTIPRQGYELVAAVEPVRTRTARYALSARLKAVAVVAVLGAIAVFAFVDRGGPEKTRLAILTLQVEQQDLGPIAESLIDDIIALASSSKQIDTLAKRSTFAFRDPQIKLTSVASALDADHILEGRLQHAGDGLSASIQLIDADSERIVWSEQLAAKDAAALSREVVAAVHDVLNRELNAQVNVLPKQDRPSEAAYRTYLSARHQWSLRGDRRIQRAIQLLRETIGLAPDFADAYLALAQALALEPFYSTEDKDVVAQFALVRRELQRAVELDASLTLDAEALEGFMQYRTRNWDEAERILLQVLQAEPDNVYANYWYAMLLSSIGKYDAALTHTQRAVASDPLSSVLMDRLAIAYLWMNDLPRAREFFSAAVEFGYEGVGENGKAYIVYLIRAREFSELRSVLVGAGLPADWSDAWAGAIEDPALVPVAIEATHAAIATGQLPHMFQFGVWTLLGQADAAFDAFEYDLKTVDIEFLWTEEAAFLRESERFAVLLERLGIANTSS